MPEAEIAELNHWRNKMYQRRLIGVYEDGIGYGNISCRRSGSTHSFHITGSATGHLPRLSAVHFTTVTGFDLEKNTVHCRGPIVASSESMSHAVIYRDCPEVRGVIHVHHARLWKFLLGRVPTTADGATYGSPEMAVSILDLLRTTSLREVKIFVMRSHPEGVFAFGNDLAEAAAVLLRWLEKLPAEK